MLRPGSAGRCFAGQAGRYPRVVTVDGEHPDDGIGDEPTFGPVPDPDDRLWRHPSEVGRSSGPVQVLSAPPRAGLAGGRFLAVAAIGGVIGALLAVGVTAWSGGVGTSSTAGSGGPQAQPQLLVGATALGTGLSALVAKTAPAVIGVTVTGGGGPDEAGSGVVVGPGNLVLTARRLLRARATVTAQAPNGRQEPATVVGDDIDSGLALLRVGGPALMALPLATVASVNPGDMAVLVGRLRAVPNGPTARGLSPTTIVLASSVPVAAGGASAATVFSPHVVVGEIRAVDGDPVVAGVPVLGTLEADMPSEEDDLGAAVLDGRGELVGVSVASDSGTGPATMATPADVAQAVLGELASAGQVTHGYLGVEGGDASTEAAHALGLDGGALVTDVKAGSPAAAAGVKVGDVVSQMDGRDISTMARLRALLRLHHPGDIIRLVLSRRDEVRTVQATLVRPAAGEAAGS